MKVFTFTASNNQTSINKKLAEYTANMIPNADIESLDMNDFDLPLYTESKEKEIGIPAAAQTFLDKISQADSIVIAFPEHNGYYTATFKNLFDWASRVDQGVYQNKPMIMLATSPGPGGASSVLQNAKTSAPFFAANIKAAISLPSFYDNFDLENNTLLHPEINATIKEAVANLN